MKESVNILGTEYIIETHKNQDDKLFDKLGCNGYCNEQLKQIIVADLTTLKEYDDMNPEMLEVERKSILRHEIVHAFFRESGLSSCSSPVTGSWSNNEEMVDWIALQGPKIYQAWKEIDAL